MSLTSRLRVLNNVLLILAIVLVLLLAWELVRYREKVSLSLPSVASLGQPMYKVEEASIPPFSTYEPIFASRDLFGPLVEPPAPQRPVSRVKKVNRPDLSTAARGLSVRGIIAGEGSLRAFIYDDKTKKKELFKVGDKIRGIQIKSISPDGVVLARNGEELALPY